MLGKLLTRLIENIYTTLLIVIPYYCFRLWIRITPFSVQLNPHIPSSTLGLIFVYTFTLVCITQLLFSLLRNRVERHPLGNTISEDM